MITSSDASETKPFMSIDEFMSEGYMQEANRRLLHPLGLSQVGVTRDDGFQLWVLDCRDEPGGIFYDQHGEVYSETRRGD